MLLDKLLDRRVESPALHRARHDTETQQCDPRRGENDRESNPILLHCVILVLQTRTEVSRHECDRQEQYCGLGNEQRDACQSLDISRFFDGDQLKVHLDQTVLLLDIVCDFAQGVEVDEVFQTFEAYSGCGTETCAEKAVHLGDCVVTWRIVVRDERLLTRLTQDLRVVERCYGRRWWLYNSIDDPDIALVVPFEDPELITNLVQAINVVKTGLPKHVCSLYILSARFFGMCGRC